MKKNKSFIILFESGKVVEVKQVAVSGNEPISSDIKKIYCRVNKQTYLQQVNKLLHHIQQGDIYEINYCVEFFAEGIHINPHKVFERLKGFTEAPFCQLVKTEDTHIICASPERFIQKKGNKLITQPMKGTARRSNNAIEDEQIKQTLKNNLKERTENVMAVDVARNDLSCIAQKGSVIVDELFGVQTFKNVHQLVSTVSCELKENISFDEIIEATFPAASMTGAPKLKAIELIKKYEASERGIYSGILGHADDNDDFDFCVVIRTIIYNEKTKRLSFHVGSAITSQCNPEEEWNECLLKAETLLKSLGLTSNDIIYQ